LQRRVETLEHRRIGFLQLGALMLDYVAGHGDGNVGGLVFLAAVNKLGGPMFASGQIGATFADPRARGIFSESLPEQVPAWNFVNRGLTTRPPERAARDFLLASSMLPPLAARTGTLTRDADHLPLLARLRTPVLAVHAQDDGIVLTRAVDQLRTAPPDAQTRLFPTGAYAPHWENAGSFNALLDAFAA
jgi:pimeloyl-ACP methyl ester carboxylesterase